MNTKSLDIFTATIRPIVRAAKDQGATAKTIAASFLNALEMVYGNVSWASPKRLPARDVVVLALDGNPMVARVTGFLRDKSSGRLDVKKVAALYGEDVKRFAAALRVSPAALRKSPFAKKYQDFLTPFEQTARILPMLDKKNQFSAWAKSPNKELGSKTPIEALFSDRAAARKLIETVEDLLVGQPG